MLGRGAGLLSIALVVAAFVDGGHGESSSYNGVVVVVGIAVWLAPLPHPPTVYCEDGLELSDTAQFDPACDLTPPRVLCGLPRFGVVSSPWAFPIS